jgi:hypothetical protein
LALHPDKTRLIRFGRHAVEQRSAQQYPPGPQSVPWGATRLHAV